MREYHTEFTTSKDPLPPQEIADILTCQPRKLGGKLTKALYEMKESIRRMQKRTASNSLMEEEPAQKIPNNSASGSNTFDF